MKILVCISFPSTTLGSSGGTRIRLREPLSTAYPRRCDLPGRAGFESQQMFDFVIFYTVFLLKKGTNKKFICFLFLINIKPKFYEKSEIIVK